MYIYVYMCISILEQNLDPVEYGNYFTNLTFNVLLLYEPSQRFCMFV